MIGSGALVGPDTTLSGVTVGEGASVVRTHGSDSVVGDRAMVGPFAYLRPGTSLGAKGKIGTFVETKNAQIGDGFARSRTCPTSATPRSASTATSAPPRVTVNYDGVNKHRTIVGSHCRTGSDNMFVAPVTVGDGAYTGAGTVLRRNVPPGALAVSGGPQRNLDGWVLSRRAGHGRGSGSGSRTARQQNADKTRGGSLTVNPQMSGTPKKNLMLFGGRAYPELTEEVAKHLNVTVTPQSAYDFANGEIFVRFEESVRGCDAFVIQSHTRAHQPVADGTADHGRRAQARLGQADHRDHAVLPVRRQDKKHRGREPISARLVADLFKTAGADRLVSVDLHTAQIQGFFDGPVDHLWAMPLLADHIREQVRGPRDHRRLPGLGSHQAGREVGRHPRRHADRVHPQDPRPPAPERGRRQPRGRQGRAAGSAS